jgi:sporulation protein YlmC with PRC-barrel domain
MFHGIFLMPMEKLYTQTIGLPVVTEYGHIVGRVFDIIVNPDTGKVAAFALGPIGQKVISPIDVITWSGALIINDEESILEQEDIQMVSRILEKNIYIRGAKVYTKSGEYMGKVGDVAYNTKTFMLTVLLIGKSFLGVYYDKKNVAHKDIIEITSGKIIIKDPLRLTPVKAKKLSPKLSTDAATSA